MVIKLHDLAPAPGAKKKPKRVGRGIGGKGGKQAGRGTKGQTKRGTVAPQFEGGQLPLVQRVPFLKGFNNPFRVEYHPINLDTLQEFDGNDITPASLNAVGLAPKGELIKVLGRGEISRAVNVSAHGFSKSARAAIETAGGTCTELPKPFGVRPAAKGNQFTNR
jgi:large subunit ribosomal protein L15